jgi:fluoride exporter
MKEFVWVFIGGGLGSICRYGIGKWAKLYFMASFPYGTFIVNLVGCFLIGLILSFLGKLPNVHPHWGLLLATGFCGGFTTFSSFAYENIMLWHEAKYITFWAYSFLSVGLGFGCVVLGLWLGKYFF